MALGRVLASLKDKPLNPTNIRLALSNARFESDLSFTNPLLRQYTAQTIRISNAHEDIQKLPNLRKDQERAETVIRQYPALKSEEYIRIYNLFVDEIQGPSTKAAKFSEQFQELLKTLNNYTKGYAGLMATLIIKVTDAIEQGKPFGTYVAELKKEEPPLKPIVADTKMLGIEGERIQETFEKLTDKANKGLPQDAKVKGLDRGPDEAPGMSNA
jgi:cysteinyl-tRNA synthetase